MAKLELPEIEVLRRDLEREIANRKVKEVELKSLKMLAGVKTKKEFTENLIGAKFLTVERLGLFLVAHMTNEHSLVIELGENASMIRCTSRTKTASDVEVTITFTQGGDLRISDKDHTSNIWVVPTTEVDTVLPDPAETGLDLLASPVSWIDFGRHVLRRNDPLKVLLTDDSVFVGVGDIYSDEILFDAGLMYDRKSSQLSTQELRRLNRSLVGILHDAIKYGGTSLEDRPFADLNGNHGLYSEHLAVYQKQGELSQRSRLPIKKAQFKGKPVYFCTTQV